MDYNFERNRINKFINLINKVLFFNGSVKEIIRLNQDLQNDNNYLTNLVPALSMPTYFQQPIMSYDYITTDPNLKTNLYNKPFAPNTSVPASSRSTAPMSTAPMSAAPMSAAPMSAAAMSTAPMSAAAMSTTPMSAAAMSTVPSSIPTSVVGDTSSITISEPTGTLATSGDINVFRLKYLQAQKAAKKAIKELAEKNAELIQENTKLKKEIDELNKLHL